MVPAGQACLYLTDGEPGGLDERLVTSCFALSLPFANRHRACKVGALRRAD